jgi:hypothetical protein
MNQKFFLNSKIENNQELAQSQFLEVSNQSNLQAIETHFQQCSNNAIEDSNSSFLNISHCTFSLFKQKLLNFQKDLKGLIHNCAFNNSNNNDDLLHFNESKCHCTECSFNGIYHYSIWIGNKSNL